LVKALICYWQKKQLLSQKSILNKGPFSVISPPEKIRMHKGLINGLQKTIGFYFMVLLVTVSGHAQQTIEKPVIHYVSEWKLDDLQFFEPGKKVIFNQQCTTSVPEKIVNGNILLENVHYGKERLQVLLEFKDTVVNAITYVFDMRNDGLIAFFEIDQLTVQGLVESDEWFYVSENKKTLISRVKRRIMIKKTGNECTSN
jgi:hypothetical protein